MADLKEFHVCIFSEGGKKIGHALSMDGDFSESIADQEKSGSNAQEQAGGRSLFIERFDEFVSAMYGFMEFAPLVLALAHQVSNSLVTDGLERYLAKRAVKTQSEEKRMIYSVPMEFMAEFQRFDESLKYAIETRRDLSRMLVAGLVASLEYHVRLLMRDIATVKPESVFNRDKTFAVREMLKIESMDDLKNAIIDAEIDDVQRGGFEDQVEWIEKRANLDKISAQYEGWANLIEIFKRRNLFVHAGGVVDTDYLKFIETNGLKLSEELRVGQKLFATPKYFDSAVEMVTEFGAKLIQVTWRKLKPDEVDLADKWMGNLGYELLYRGRYGLAIKMLEFGSSLRNISTDERRRTMIVNLANATKLNGNLDKACKILDAEDWSATGLEFKICVAAVKDRVEEVSILMRRIGASGEVAVENYSEWPVFYGVRDSEAFRQAFREVFGVEYVPVPKQKSSLMALLDHANLEDEKPSAPLVS